jgi:MFS transporter, PPP family, 3-phenylpropionic acid transporter
MVTPAPAITDAFALRLSVFYGGLFVALGIQMPFLPVWLAAKGLDADAIGIVLAAPLLLRILAVPVATGAADRLGALRGVLIAAAFATAAGYAALGFAAGFWPLLIMVALASAAFTSIFPLADAYALKGLALRGRSYGSVRLWGSGAFIVGSLGAGLLTDRVQPVHFIWIMAAGFLAMALSTTALQPLDAASPTRGRDGARLAFLRSPGFLSVAAAASLIQASHAVFYGFSALDWTAAGLSGHAIGALWAIGVVAEIVVFALAASFAWLGPAGLLVVGATGAVVRWGAMALEPPLLWLAVLQCLHGLSFGATHLGAVQYLARAAPERLGATAQGYLAISLGVVMAGFMALSGSLYGAYGSRAYVAMAIAAALGGALALVAQRCRDTMTPP